MPVIPKNMRIINAFEDVRVLTNKEIYEKVGKRAPQMPKTGGRAIFGISKVESISVGEELVVRSYNAQIEASERETREAIEKAKAEASAVAQQEAPAQS